MKVGQRGHEQRPRGGISWKGVERPLEDLVPETALSLCGVRIMPAEPGFLKI